MEKKRFRYDIIFISVMLCLSLLLVIMMFLSKKIGTKACVEIDGELIAEYSLSVDGEYPLNGGSNILKIESGEVYLIYADCPDNTCVKTGKIHYVGQSIICLPNRLTVIIRGADNTVDVIS